MGVRFLVNTFPVFLSFRCRLPWQTVKRRARNKDSFTGLGLAAGDARIQMDDAERVAADTVFVLRSSVFFRVVAGVNASFPVEAKSNPHGH